VERTPAAEVDPRAALLAALAFVVFVASFPRHGLAPLLPLAGLALLAVILSAVPTAVLLRRLAVAAPFAAAVGVADPFLDRQPYLELAGLAISAGWMSFATLLLKVLLCVTAAVVLGALVPLPRLSWAMRALHAPRALATQVGLLVRYLGVLGAEAVALRRARELRSGGARRARGLRIAAAMLASLLHRSLDRAERIHDAMAARGFDGELRLLSRPAWRAADTVLLLVVLAACAAVRFLPLVDWLGGWTHG
jgi:cobalt/nickel transport system permease protein